MGKKKKSIYQLWVNATIKNKLEFTGLCSEIQLQIDERTYSNYKKIMGPTLKDQRKLFKKGLSILYWGSDSRYHELNTLTPLRENLLLLYACYKNENINPK
jgi:hypothetical protein